MFCFALVSLNSPHTFQRLSCFLYRFCPAVTSKESFQAFHPLILSLYGPDPLFIFPLHHHFFTLHGSPAFHRLILSTAARPFLTFQSNCAEGLHFSAFIKRAMNGPDRSVRIPVSFQFSRSCFLVQASIHTRVLFLSRVLLLEAQQEQTSKLRIFLIKPSHSSSMKIPSLFNILAIARGR